MVPRAVTAAALVLAAAGCGAPKPVSGVVDIPRDASTEGPALAFHGRLRPASARLVVRGAVASASVDAAGAFVVWLRGLRPGTTRVALVGTAPGREPWRTLVDVRRGRSGVARRYEVQGTEPDRGSPGAEEPSGGKVDLGIRDFAFFPARVRMRVSQIAVWHNLDHVEHTIVAAAGGPPGPDAARLRFNDRYEFTALRPGVVRYACTIHPWVRGELVIVPRESSAKSSSGLSGA
jgi:plastocyanin